MAYTVSLRAYYARTSLQKQAGSRHLRIDFFCHPIGESSRPSGAEAFFCWFRWLAPAANFRMALRAAEKKSALRVS
jgi:hypothetical protein